jgi:hypothetical protein
MKERATTRADEFSATAGSRAYGISGRYGFCLDVEVDFASLQTARRRARRPQFLHDKVVSGSGSDSIAKSRSGPPVAGPVRR